jgi:hypothetical protein
MTLRITTDVGPVSTFNVTLLQSGSGFDDLAAALTPQACVSSVLCVPPHAPLGPSGVLYESRFVPLQVVPPAYLITSNPVGIAGQAVGVTVAALQGSGATDTNYAGTPTLRFAMTADSKLRVPTCNGMGSNQPAGVTFRNGMATISCTFYSVQSVSITVFDDRTSPPVQATLAVNVSVDPGALDHYKLDVAASQLLVAAGTPVTINVTSFDQPGNLKTDDTAVRALTFSQAGAARDGTAPTCGTVTASFVGGQATVTCVFYLAELVNLTACDAQNVCGKGPSITITKGAIVQLGVLDCTHVDMSSDANISKCAIRAWNASGGTEPATSGNVQLCAGLFDAWGNTDSTSVPSVAWTATPGGTAGAATKCVTIPGSAQTIYVADPAGLLGGSSLTLQ